MEREHKLKGKTCAVWIVILLLGLYFANFFSNILTPQKQLYLDTDSLSQNVVTAFVFGETPQILEQEADSHYRGSVSIDSHSYQLDVTTNEMQVENCIINGVEYPLISVARYTTSGFYSNTYCVQLKEANPARAFVFGLFLLVFVSALLGVFREITQSKSGISVLTYSSAGVRAIGKKPIIISFVVALISLVFYYGCDLNVISESIIMWQKGIDIYQLDACINEYKHMELYMWQYEGAMLAGYSLPSYLVYPLITFFRPEAYHWVQAVAYKLINILLINGTVLTVLSFLIEKKAVKESQAKSIYYFSVFNPLTFWIALIFIQFDMLPIYCITLGVLLLARVKEYPLTGAFVLGYGLSCKVTGLMLLPSVCFLLVSLFVSFHNLRKSLLCYGAVFAATVFLLFFVPRVTNSPIHLAFHAVPQANRIWYTVFPYVHDLLFVYVAIAGLVFVFLQSTMEWNIKSTLEEYLVKTLLMFAVITLVFSALTISTPSFYLTTLPAFVLFSAYSVNNYERLLKSAFSILSVASFFLRPEGDITATMKFFGYQPIFTQLLSKFEEQGLAVQWNSLLFTLSVAAMLAYAKVFVSFMSKIRIGENVAEV